MNIPFVYFRRELLIRFEKLILLDPDLATKQNIEQMLWKSVFYHMVELIRKQLAEDHSEETKLSLNKILDEVCCANILILSLRVVVFVNTVLELSMKAVELF